MKRFTQNSPNNTFLGAVVSISNEVERGDATCISGLFKYSTDVLQ